MNFFLYYYNKWSVTEIGTIMSYDMMLVCHSPFVFVFISPFIYVLHAPNKVKEDSILSEHFSISIVVAVFLHCAVSYFGSVFG